MAAIRRLARRARANVNEFIAFCFRDGRGQRLRQSALHHELQEFLSRCRRGLVELPRDHGKSTQLSARLVWELGRNRGLRVVLVCAAEALAAQRSRFIRDALCNNPRVRLVFPELRPARPWAVSSFAIERPGDAIGPNVIAIGLGAFSTGTRADLLVCDDIVDVRSLHSPAERERTARDFFNNLLNLLEPDGRFWGLCTPWHPDDLNARLKRNGEFQFFRRAVGPHCEPVWPERWPQEALEARRREIGAAAFARGYQLAPIAENELAIRPEWLQFWRERPAAFERVILSIDPAVGRNPGADRSAVAALGLVGGVVHCLWAAASRAPAPGLVELIAEADRIWRPEAILFESNGGFAALADILKRHAAFGPKLVPVPQTRAKAARVAAFAVAVQSGRFLAHESQQELIAEMTSFPHGEHDDLLDAAATGTAWLLNQSSELRVWSF